MHEQMTFNDRNSVRQWRRLVSEAAYLSSILCRPSSVRVYMRCDRVGFRRVIDKRLTVLSDMYSR